MQHAQALRKDSAPELPYQIDWKNPDYDPVVTYRTSWLTWLREDPSRWEALKTHYKDNPADFIEHWGWTFDPRNSEIGRSVTMPFCLFPRQRKYIDWLHASWKDRGDGVVEKSRDMGVTWLCAAFAVWMWIFHPGAVVGFGSRKEEYVDKLGDPKSIFWKVRQFINMLPWELRPVGYEETKHAFFMRIINPETGAVIVGEAGDNIGRGNRTSIYFKDESAFYEHADAIDAALSMTSNVKIDVSTPNGTGNAFYRKRHGGKIPVFVFDWRDDPRKDQAWYDDFKSKHDPVIVAQEVDRNYEASVIDAWFPGPLVDGAMRRGPAEVQPLGALRVGVDVARFGNNKTVISFRIGRVLVKQIPLSKMDTIQTASRVKFEIESFGRDPEQIAVDVIGVGAGVADALRMWYPDKPGRNGGSPRKVVADVVSSLRMDNGIDYNLRAFMAREVKEWLKTASIPNDPELRSDLTSMRYLFKGGLLLMESKEDAIGRGVKSPDFYDSLGLTFGVPTIVKVERRTTVKEGPYVKDVM